jgi:uncharacterized membrane protein YoaK (UPF0700 family)
VEAGREGAHGQLIPMPDSAPTRELDRWLLIGGPLLALVAGYVNVILLMQFAVPVSHVTGSIAHLALDGARDDVWHLRLAAAMVSAFLLGAMLTGYWIEGPMFQHRRRYGLVFIAQGLAFAASAWLLHRQDWFAVPASALGCGMQNALATSYRGLNLRTTHMTGIVTDIGVLLGLRARGHRIRLWRFALLCLIFSGYVAGTFLGVYAGRELRPIAMMVPAALCLVGGAVYALAFPLVAQEAKPGAG